MDSEQRPSTPLPDTPLAGVGPLAAGLRAHRQPLVASFTGLRPLSGVGDVGRAAMRFGALTFLSQSARRREVQRVGSADRMLVRPPDYWSGNVAEEEAEQAQPMRTGDAAYDALIARRTRVLRAARPPAHAPRGLPSTIHRRGRSMAGPMTGPGSMVRRLTPAPVAVVPNPATTGGKLTIAATPAPQAPRRPRARPPSETRSPRGGPDRPGHRAPPSRGPGPLAPAPTTTAPDGAVLRRLSRTATPTPDAISTPSFDALLDAVATGPEPTAPASVASEIPSGATAIERPGSVDAHAIARVYDAKIDAPSTTATFDASPMRAPARASRAARALPYASVSVHAASHALHAPTSDDGAVRRLSFARSSALAGRSPWDDVTRQPVGIGTTAVPVGATARSDEPVRRTTHGAELQRTRAGVGVAWVAPRAAHGVGLRRTFRTAPSSPTSSAATVRRSSSSAGAPAARQAGESLADAVRRVFGEPAAADAAGPSGLRPVAPPAGVPVARTPAPATAQPARVLPFPDRRATSRRVAVASAPLPEATSRPTAPVVDGGHWAAISRWPSASIERADGGGAARGTLAAAPGSLFARATASEQRSFARPGSVLSAPTTHAPLARSDHAVADSRIARIDTARLAVGTPPLAPAPSTSRAQPSAPARREPGRATSRRTEPASNGRDAVATTTAADARTAAVHAIRQAELRTAARTALRRLPLSAAGGALAGVRHPSAVAPGTRGSTSFAAPASTTARRTPGAMPARSIVRRRVLGGSLLLPTAGAAAGSTPMPQTAGTHIAQRLAALTGSTAFDLVRRLPVGSPPLLPASASAAARSDIVQDQAAARSGRDSTRTAPASRGQNGGGVELVRRTLALPNARVLPSAEGHAADLAAARAGADPSANHIARRLAALESPADAVRRLPVGAPAVVLAGQQAATPGRLVRRSAALATAPVPVAGPGGVLPGRRATPNRAASRSAARPVANRSSAPEPTTTAARLRDMVANRAFDAPPGTPIRRSADAAMPVAPPAPVLRTAADRFEHVQRTAVTPDRPVALPARFRPLAERIVGPRIAVQVVHGAVTRKALAAAGHDAATTDRVIHLPTRPDASARTMSIVAHELEHVAAPSAVARFHGGVDSPEETRAVRTEQIVRRLAKGIDERGGGTSAAGTSGLPVGGLTAFGRSGAGAASAGASAPTSTGPPGPAVPASAIQRQSSSTVSRSPATGSGTMSSTSTSNEPVRRLVVPEDAVETESGGSGGFSAGGALSPAQLSAIIRAVEDRLLEEIERRGGLSRGAF